MSIKVLKFGGTSMGTTESISQCAQIVKKTAEKEKTIVVVSALSKVTNELIELIELAKSQRSSQIIKRLDALEQRHKQTLKPFVNNLEKSWVIFIPIFKELRQILTGISLVGDISEKTSAAIWSYGERLSSWIMHFALIQENVANERVIATKLIKTDSNYLNAAVDFSKTKVSTKKVIGPVLKSKSAVVVTGFIGSDDDKHLTTLGRGGSDYTASILGLSMGAKDIEIWTDVDGVMSADPRIIKDAKVWKEINIDVMSEMAYIGAKVLHPKTISPALLGKIPVYIKNTFKPTAPGTKIVEADKKGIKGIVVKKDQTLLHLSNPIILNQIGTIHEYSHVFADNDISIDVCATSEISITFSINSKDKQEKLFEGLRELANLDVNENMAKVCIVGSHIGNDAKILAKIFNSLEKYKIYTISNSASFNNITLMVKEKDADEILKVLHKRLF